MSAAALAGTLVVATASRSAEQIGDTAHARFPRVDYIELGERIGVDVLDYGVYPDGRRGSALRWMETQLRSDPYLAWQALRRAPRYARMLCMSERVAIPLAALRRAGVYRGGLAVLFQAWSHRQEAVVTRLNLFRAMDWIGVNCTAMRERFIAHGAAPARVQLMRWAIDHTFFTPPPRAESGTFVFSLGEVRGRDYTWLFEAVDGLPIELRVLPSGYAGAREKERAAFARIPDNVRVLPRVSTAQLRDLYTQSRFVVLPLRDVIYPAGVTAALEAMCTARAVIATRSRGLSDYLIDGENCLLVEPGDRAALRAAIERLAGDPALARRLGENGRARVERTLNQRAYVEQLAGLVRDWATQ